MRTKNRSNDHTGDRSSTFEVEHDDAAAAADAATAARQSPSQTDDNTMKANFQQSALESLFTDPPKDDKSTIRHSPSSSSSPHRAPAITEQPRRRRQQEQQEHHDKEEDGLCDPLLPPPPPHHDTPDTEEESPTTSSSSVPLPPPSSSSSSSSPSRHMTVGRWVMMVLSHPHRMIVRGGRGMISDESRRYVREVIRRAGNYLAYATLLIMLIAIPNVVYTGVKTDQIDVAAYNSAGVMVLGTIVLSFRLVYLHLTHWYMPEVQKYVVRILWMVPLYAVQSWLSLRFHGSRIYIDTVRDFYEAYVIASFVYYLIELLGGEEGLIHILEGKDNPALGRHTFPLSLILEPWELGEDFMLQCKHGVLQYVVFKVVATSLTLLFEFVGIYGEGQFHWMVAYPYLVTFQNVSVCYALYCLVMLYSAVDDELRYPINWRPLGKFLCVKGVVFFCWWQGVLIFYLEAHGIISNAGSRWSAQDVAYGLIDYCIVLEMVLFAIAHSYTFTYKDYLPSNLPTEYLAQQQQQQQQQSDSTVNDTERGRMGSNPQSPEDNPLADAVPLPTGALQATQSGSSGTSRASSYRPPATLDRPMGFTDAFWSSTLPKETIEDIQRLRVGREFVVAALRPRTGSQESAGWRQLATTTAPGERSEHVNHDEDMTDSNNDDTESPIITENASGPNNSP